MEVVLWPWDERSSIWWLKTLRPVTCSNNRSSPSMTAWFHCMISENGSSQPLLSNTGMQAACTQQNTETHIIVFRVIQRHDGGTKRFILYRNDHKTPLKTHLSSVRHITSHHYTSTTRRVWVQSQLFLAKWQCSNVISALVYSCGSRVREI